MLTWALVYMITNVTSISGVGLFLFCSMFLDTIIIVSVFSCFNKQNKED